MRIIYDGEKHRSPWKLLYSLGFAALVVWITGTQLMEKVEAGLTTVSALIATMVFGLAGWLVYANVRFYLKLPVDMSILDSGAIQVRTRSGEQTYAATQFIQITYIYEGSAGTLHLKGDTQTWHLATSQSEAEEIIAALVALNPDIRVVRKEDRSGA